MSFSNTHYLNVSKLFWLYNKIKLLPEIICIIKFYRKSKLGKNIFEVLRDFFLTGWWNTNTQKNKHSHQLREHSLPPFNPITFDMCVILTIKHDMLTVQVRCCFRGRAIWNKGTNQNIWVSCIWMVGHSLTIWQVINGQSKSHQLWNINWVGPPTETWDSGMSLD